MIEQVFTVREHMITKTLIDIVRHGFKHDPDFGEWVRAANALGMNLALTLTEKIMENKTGGLIIKEK